MKFLASFLFFILLFSSLAYADTERVTLFPGGSFLFQGKNITLVDTSDDSVIVCVNRAKTIISDEKTVDGVIISVTDSDESNARLRLDYECDEDCSCDGDECNNNVCLESIASLETTTETTTEQEETSVIENGEETTTDEVESTVEQDEESTASTDDDTIKKVTYALIGVAIVFGIAAYSRRGKKENTLEEYMKEAEEY